MTKIILTRSKLMLGVLVITALMLVTAAATYSLLSNDNPINISVFSNKEPEDKAHFMKLDKFVISVDGEERTHYLMLELALKTNSASAHQDLIEFNPLVRNVLLKMFSKKSYEDLRQMNEIEELQLLVRNQLSQELLQNGYGYKIDDVLFTKMVIQ